MEKLILEGINKALTEYVSKEWDKHIAELNRDKDVWIAGVVLNLTKQMNIDSMGQNIIITLRKDVQK